MNDENQLQKPPFIKFVLEFIDVVTKRVKVHGRVQGVWYRASAKREADKLGIKGWVMNLPDRCVLLEVQGKPEAVEQFISWCRKGPELARVLQIDIETRSGSEKYKTFEIKRNN